MVMAGSASSRLLLMAITLASVWTESAASDGNSHNCSEPFDLLLLIDASASVDETEMDMQMQFAKALVERMDVSMGNVHVAISFFANYYRHRECFSHDKAAILNKLDTLTCDECEDGQTSTGLAFKGAREEVFVPACGVRDQAAVPRIVFHLTDGASTEAENGYGDDFMETQKNLLWDSGVYVISVGVGNKMRPGHWSGYYEATEEISHKIFRAKQFSDLAKILDETEEAICDQAKEGPAPVKCQASVDVAVVMDYSNSMGLSRTTLQKSLALKVLERLSSVEGVSLQVALTLVARGVFDRFCFNDHGNDSAAILDAIANVECTECGRGGTYIGQSLQRVREHVLGGPACGSRGSATKLVLLLTDAKSTEAEDFWQDQATLLKDLGHEVVVVGFDPAHMHSAGFLASRPENSFGFTETNGLLKRLAEILPSQCGEVETALCEEGWSYNPADETCMKYFNNLVKAKHVTGRCGGEGASWAMPRTGVMDLMIGGLRFGAGRKVHTGFQKQSGVWGWADGGAGANRRWRPGQPKGKGDCAFMPRKGQKWKLAKCKKRAAYACVKPLA